MFNLSDLKDKKGGGLAHAIIAALFAVLIVYLIVFLGTLTRNEVKKRESIGKVPAERRTVSIDGSGKVVGAPDIATVELGFTTERPDVQGALQENNTKMNRLNDELKKLGIAPADIQTTRYNVYPNYEYPADGGRRLTSYTADQGVTVKIRDLGRISFVLQAAGNVGANQVSGLNFTIEDPDKIRAEAREKAIRNAVEKAKVLGAQLGINLGKVVNFSENTGGYPVPIYAYKELGLGGGSDVAAPSIQPGSLDVTSNIVLTFEIE